MFIGNGDDRNLREIFESERIEKIQSAFAGYRTIVIDEAQRISNVGMGLKIIADHLPQFQCIATGSSSFDLSNKIGEPLTGRSISMILYPISMIEIAADIGRMGVMSNLENYLIYGTYPEILTTVNDQEKIETLILLRDAYLFKDILELDNIKNASKFKIALGCIEIRIK